MGSGEKKNRREVERVLNRFVLRDGEETYPFRTHPEARDMIVEFAKPLEGLFGSLMTRYSFAIFAWNLSLVEEERRHELAAEFLSPLMGENEEGKSSLTELLTALTARRLEHYPEEEFLILPSDDDEPLGSESDILSDDGGEGHDGHDFVPEEDGDYDEE